MSFILNVFLKFKSFKVENSIKVIFKNKYLNFCIYVLS